MKRLKLFESFKEDWLNKISDLKSEGEKDALSKIQEIFFDLTDDFDNDGVIVNIPEYGKKNFLEFKVNFMVKSSKIEDFILRLSDVKLRLKEALGFNIKVSKTHAVNSEMSNNLSNWPTRIQQECHFRILDIESYSTLEDILNGKFKRGDESYDQFFDDLLHRVVSYRLGLPRNEMSEILQRDEILFKFELFIS